MTPLETDIILAVTIARKAEVFLTALGATGDGLGKKIASIKSQLSKLSLRFLGDLQVFNSARNDLVHSKPTTMELPEPFALLASKLDVQMDYFAKNMGIVLPVGISERPDPASAAGSSGVSAPLDPNGPQQIPVVNGSDLKKGQRAPIEPIDLEILPPEAEINEREQGMVNFGTRLPPRSWIVDGTDGLGDFATIQEAIDAAHDGDSIRVLPGSYEGPIKIEKNIIVEGQGQSDETVITAADDILYVAGYGAKIARLTFRADNPRVFGIVAANLSLVVIAECAFDIKGGTGVVAFDDASLRIEGCSIAHCKHGLRITGASVEVFKTHFAENTNAILVQAGGTAKIYNNDFAQNGTGVEVQAEGHAEVSGNRFTGGSAGVIADENAQGSVQSNNYADLPDDAAIFRPTGSSKMTTSESQSA